MSYEHNSPKQFKSFAQKRDGDARLFLASAEEVVRHMARLAAERDFKAFLSAHSHSTNLSTTDEKEANDD